MASLFFSLAAAIEATEQAAVREIRRTHPHTGLGFVVNLGQTMIMIGIMYGTAVMMGFGANMIRGDYLLYVITGIFLYMVHVKAMAAVSSSESPLTAAGKALPVNATIAALGAALAALWMQGLSVLVIVFLYHALWLPITIDDPGPLIVMILLAWASGAGLGLLVAGLRPWNVALTSLLSQFYMRISMILSGSMFAANALPAHYLPWFMWNPLFHMTDQARGAAFINYSPWFTSAGYAAICTGAIMILGALVEFHTRHRASLSWFSRR